MLRVIGGSLRGRRFAAPPGRHTRPTADKVREALFNALGAVTELAGAHVWDLFAGSGALGIEALSRGAADCTFVESHGRTAGVVRGNLRSLGLEPHRAQVVVARVEAWLARRSQVPGTGPAALVPATLVLADPPYADRSHDALLAALGACPSVAPDAVIVLETGRGAEPVVPPSLERLQVRGYGDTQLHLFAKRPAIAGPQGEEPTGEPRP